MLSHDCLSPGVSLDFPQAKYCLFGSAVACICEIIHLSLFWGVWMWLKSFDVYIKCLFSTKTECFYCLKYEHVSVEKKSQKTSKCTAMRVYS